MKRRVNRTWAVCTAFLLLLAAQPSTAFDGIRLTPLGGTGAMDAAPAATGTLVEASDEVLVFDCGAGYLGRLRGSRCMKSARTSSTRLKTCA